MGKGFVVVPVVAALILAGGAALRAQSPPPAALDGVVSSAAEGRMEGVLVSARREGGTVTTTVVSGKDGRYRFPASRLQPGRYTIAVRAAGYELDRETAVEVAPQRAVSRDLRLRPAHDVAAQLSNSEWMMSIPGADEQKRALLECVGCHTLQRIVESRHTAAEWPAVLQRMADYANVSFPLHPQRRIANSRSLNPAEVAKLSGFLASINESRGPRGYALRTLPRLAGPSTHVVITEYDLPRKTIEPHDVIVDERGTVWFSDFGEEMLGALDPRTGKVTEYAIPPLKPRFPTGSLALEPDRDGHLWMAMMFQGGIARFDKASRAFTTWPIPAPYNSDISQVSFTTAQSAADGKVWFNDVQTRHVFRLDPASGKVQYIGRITNADGHSTENYEMVTDSRGNLYTLDFSPRDGNYIGEVDAATLQTHLYPVPTHNSRPRRGHMDARDRLWFAEYAGNKLAMFDTRTKDVREWAMPRSWWQPYDAALDKEGMVWTAGMHADRVARLDPASGRIVEYQLPRETNVRRVFVDDSTTPPTFWIGNNHQASIVKVELVE